MQVISDLNINLNGLNADEGKANSESIITIKVKINTKEQLNALIKKLKNIRGVTDVYRMNC